MSKLSTPEEVVANDMVEFVTYVQEQKELNIELL